MLLMDGKIEEFNEEILLSHSKGTRMRSTRT
jgi:hypothetical protein